MERKASMNRRLRTGALDWAEITRSTEIVMAKVIKFYVPKNFRKPLKWATQLQCGKVIEFCSQTQKSASSWDKVSN